MNVPVVIIGAGLAGFTCAHELAKHGIASTILEARDRIGGRIISHPTQGVIDLGPAWTWPSHDKHLAQLANELGIKSFPQVNEGSDISQGQGFQSGWAQGTHRFPFKGTQELITRLHEKHQSMVDGNQLLLNSQVERIEHTGTHVNVTIKQHTDLSSSGGDAAACKEDDQTGGVSEIRARAVIVAAPPRVVAKTIQFSPALGKELHALLVGTPTWMGNTLKIVAVYPTPFWRATGLSGASFNFPPLNQIWDNSFTDSDGKEHFALSGFIMGQSCANLVGQSSEHVRDLVLPQLVEIYGEQARTEMKEFMHLNWLDEPWTFVNEGESATRSFGSPVLREGLWAGRLVLAGTETEEEDGHMEGAVMSGLRAAGQVLEVIKTDV